MSEARRIGGYAVWTEPDKATIERDTFRCVHCQFVIVKEPKEDPTDKNGWCQRCFAIICTKCAATGVCDPFIKKIERSEEQGRRSRELMNRVRYG